MAFRKSNDPRPQILDVSPVAAIPGGEFQIRGKGLAPSASPNVRFGEMAAPVVSRAIEDYLKGDARIAEVRLIFYTAREANIFLENQTFSAL